MTQFTATHFRFEVEALTTLAFDHYTGSSLRGSLVTALQRNFCSLRDQADAAHQATCPVCWLLSYEATSGDSRRPYTVEPLLGDRRYFVPGERFHFGLTLFGHASTLFPYLALAVPQMGSEGIGRVLEQVERGTWHRGRFALRRIEELNPLTNTRRTLLDEGQQMVHTPQQPVTAAHVAAAATLIARRVEANGGRLGLHFLTPTRIVDHKALVHQPHFRPLFQRLAERINELQRTFGGAEQAAPDWSTLLALAGQVELEQDETGWWDVQGHSSRLEREQQLGGFTGAAFFRADPAAWARLLPWLVWGLSTHVGKNAVKGSGWYRLTMNKEG